MVYGRRLHDISLLFQADLGLGGKPIPIPSRSVVKDNRQVRVISESLS